MSNVITLESVNKSHAKRNFRAIRESYDLTQAEAAVAMGTSPATIENWERKNTAVPDLRSVKIRLQRVARRKNAGETLGKNMLFDHYPLRMARTMLKLDLEGIAAMFDYSTTAWQRFESNNRPLNREKLDQLEEEIRKEFKKHCL
ncbi:MAG: helix-turn-helix domain-containing protein [Oleispira sp.]|nr:helix-turn-helix domain-containing protein [Oleispira sp.]